MALTEAQVLSLHQIMGCPGGDRTWQLLQDGLTVIDGQSPGPTIESYIASRLAELTAAELTRLTACIVQWDAVEYDTVAVNGAVGNISGIILDPERIRQRCREVVQAIIPAYGDWLKHVNTGAGGNLEVIR
jgi:hypothetical protein